MKNYETDTEERAGQGYQVRVQGNGSARFSDLGGQGTAGREIRNVFPVDTQNSKEQKSRKQAGQE